MGIRETRCRGCCATPFGVCATEYRCHHHVEDAETAQTRADASSLRRDLRLYHRPMGGALSEDERTAVEGLQGVEVAHVVAARYGVSESTVRSVWVKHRRRLKDGAPASSPPPQDPGEVVALIDRIRATTGWSIAEVARRAGVADRTLRRLRRGDYVTVSKKVMGALDDLAHREGINAYAH